MTVKTLQYVTIGDEYAKRLGYEGLVGSMAIVDNVLEALVGVTVISGPPAMIGKQVDIHKGDALLKQNEAPVKLYAVADFINGRVYYSKDKYFAEKCCTYLGRNQTQLFDDFDYMHELLDELHRRYGFKRTPTPLGFAETIEKMDWMAYNLDDESCHETKTLRDTYQAGIHADELRKKRTMEMELKKIDAVKSLTDSFKSQLTAHIEGPGVHIEWNPDDAAADQLDSYSEDYEQYGKMSDDGDDGFEVV